MEDNKEAKLDKSDHLKILSILYCIIFSHFIESQLNCKTYKETIKTLEDKIQKLKDQIIIEKGTSNTLKSELILTK